MPIGKKVTVKIRTEQKIQGNRDSAESEAAGEYYEKENAFHIIYKEEGRTTHIRVALPVVHVHRFGDLSGDIWFVEGDRRDFSYETPHGRMIMAADTHKIRWDPAGKELFIRYNILAEDRLISMNEMKLKMREIKE